MIFFDPIAMAAQPVQAANNGVNNQNSAWNEHRRFKHNETALLGPSLK